MQKKLFLFILINWQLITASDLDPNKISEVLKDPIEYCRQRIQMGIASDQRKVIEKNYKGNISKNQKEEINKNAMPEAIRLIDYFENVITGSKNNQEITSKDKAEIFYTHRCVHIVLYYCVCNNKIDMANTIIENVFLFDKKILAHIKKEMSFNRYGKLWWRNETMCATFPLYATVVLKDDETNSTTRSLYIKELINSFLSSKDEDESIKIKNVTLEKNKNTKKNLPKNNDKKKLQFRDAIGTVIFVICFFIFVTYVDCFNKKTN